MRNLTLYSVGAIIVFLAGFASAQITHTSINGSWLPTSEPTASTLTDSLTARLHAAWNAEDMDALRSQLQPSAFFKSPYQLRYGRENMEKTVLITNPPVFKVFEQIEHHSHVSKNLAWSIGHIRSHIHENGSDTGEIGEADYLYVFTPDEHGSWRVQMMIYHEE
jgi:hypothetical protein